ARGEERFCRFGSAFDEQVLPTAVGDLARMGDRGPTVRSLAACEQEPLGAAVFEAGKPHVEQRGIRAEGTATDEYRVGAGAFTVDVGAGRLASDPFAGAVGPRNEAVRSDGELESDFRKACRLGTGVPSEAGGAALVVRQDRFDP